MPSLSSISPEPSQTPNTTLFPSMVFKFSWMRARGMNPRKCCKARLLFTYEQDSKLCKVGPAWMSGRDSDSPCCCPQSEVPFTFTGDTVGHQLVAHKARADDLLTGVSALLFAGPATCNQDKWEPGTGHMPWTRFPRSVWAGPEEMSSVGRQRMAGSPGWSPCSPHSTPPSPGRPRGVALGTPGDAASGPSPGMTSRVSWSWKGPGRQECDAATRHRHRGSWPHAGGRA